MTKKDEIKKQNKSLAKGMVGELKKVTWPSRKEVLVYTFVVMVAITITAIVTYFYDAGLTKVMTLIKERLG